MSYEVEAHADYGNGTGYMVRIDVVGDGGEAEVLLSPMRADELASRLQEMAQKVRELRREESERWGAKGKAPRHYDD